MNNRIYICIDLKSFYASVECVLRGLDPMVTNLVVADASRTEKTICLAVSPALKTFGLPGRARLFEVIQKLDEINKERLKHAPNRKFIEESYDLNELNNYPEYKISFLIAPPQMAKYIEISSKIYSVYLKYVAPEDIHVYSIDEVFMDVTNYLYALNMTPHELAKKMIKDVLNETGVTATAGIGTNMYLAKVAMDIVAKHIEPDSDGVRIAYLDEMLYRKRLWDHKPLTDFWRVGHGIANRLNKLGLETMGDIARCSIGKLDNYYNEEILYKEFGINAELLIDHAWGYEPTLISDIKAYRPKANSLSSGQVLSCGYTFDKALIIVKEMTELLSLDLVGKGLVTDQLVLHVGYDIDNLSNEEIMKNYKGEIATDYIGRSVPKSAHGSINIDSYTSQTTILIKAIIALYKEIVDPILLVRRLNIAAVHLIPESEINKRDGYVKISLFEDYEEKERKNKLIEEKRLKEKNLRQAIIGIKSKYGKNAVLKAMNLEEGATTRERNEQIGGHKS